MADNIEFLFRFCENNNHFENDRIKRYIVILKTLLYVYYYDLLYII